MKVDSMAVDLGFDMRCKLILSRVEQLVRQEASALVESKSLTYSLQRKVGKLMVVLVSFYCVYISPLIMNISCFQQLKSQKDQLESKGLHVQLLRKKVSDLEEEKRSRSALAVQRDDAHVEAKRLQKKLERLQVELRATRQSNTELKAQLIHANELKVEGRRVQPQIQSRGIFTS